MINTGTLVTCVDVTTLDTESQILIDDYVLITDGTCYMAKVDVLDDGTHLITVRGRK